METAWITESLHGGQPPGTAAFLSQGCDTETLLLQALRSGILFATAA